MSLTPVALLDQVGELQRALSTEGPRGRDRVSSLEWLHANGMPTSKDEAWKYTPLKDVLARQVDRLATDSDGLGEPRDLAAVAVLSDEIRVVLVDGVHRPDLSSDTGDSGLSVEPLDQPTVATVSVDPAAQPRVDGFQMLNRALGISGVYISVPAGVNIERPVHVVHVSGDSDAGLFVQPRVDIHLGTGASLTLLESFVGSSASAFVNAFSSVVLENDALLRHYKIEAQAPGSIHLSSISARQATGSALKAGAFMFGAAIARNSVDVLAAGDHTNTDLYGLYLPKGSQHIDNVVTVEHAGRNGTSHQTYKGVIDDRARGSFSGHIVVDHGTVGTDAHQSNKSLLLDPAAQSDSRPWLEIFADDVACTHGSAIGQLDEKALFYMRSRGIPRDDARAILVGGFINEIVERLTTESVREVVMERVKEQVRSGFTADLGGEE